MIKKPYYQDDFVTIYHGDCGEIMPALPVFDLLLSDPPYGIGEGKRKKVLSREKLAKAKDYGEQEWDNCPVEDWLLLLCISKTRDQIIFGGNYYALPPSPCWLIWDKQNGDNDFADCELAWTSLKKAARLKQHLWHGMIRKGNEDRHHPTQKPLGVIAWALSQAGEVETVLDPFAGSGTTGRAAKDIGKKSTLIERDEAFCEIAAKRMSQECFTFKNKKTD